MHENMVYPPLATQVITGQKNINLQWLDNSTYWRTMRYDEFYSGLGGFFKTGYIIFLFIHRLKKKKKNTTSIQWMSK
jgi:hypothetical protein